MMVLKMMIMMMIMKSVLPLHVGSDGGEGGDEPDGQMKEAEGKEYERKHERKPYPSLESSHFFLFLGFW